MTDSAQTTATTGKPLALLAYLGGIAGIGVAALALAGPLVVWMGMGDFRQGFGFLRSATTYAPWIGGAALLIAVLVFAAGKQKRASGSGRLAMLSLVGAICAGLVWYVPQTYAPPEGTPVIHDVATDPYNPLEFVAIAPLRADAPNNMEYGVMEGVETVQEHIDLQTAAFPDLVPQVYEAPSSEVYERALAAVNALGWEVVAADAASGRIEATDTTFWFHFKDDVVIQVSDNADGNAVLQARSLSRVGRGDVGKNAARLRELFARLDASG